MAKIGSSVPGKPTAPSVRISGTSADPTPPARKEPARTDDQALDDLQTAFGENVKAARLQAGLKQSELAEKIGLKQQYLSLVETGRKNLTLRTMVVIAKALGKDVISMLRRPRERR